MLADLSPVPALRKAAQQLSQLSSDRRAARLVRECHRLLSVRAEANSPAIARNIIAELETLSDGEFDALFDSLAREFSPDPQAVLEAAQAYAADASSGALAKLSTVAEPPRQELFRRLNRAPGGTAALVRLRRHLLLRLRQHDEWQSVEADLLHLLSSWFNPGFLEMRRVDWSSPAHLLEQIIQHEAVHAIDGWDDLRRRLQPDRRCFAFFHPQLANVPLIFVEVALVPAMPDAIAPLIAKNSDVTSPKQFRVAAFYSISNCEPGLRGVSLGNFLIKRVAEELKKELPQLKTFCTLSPIPGFMTWLARGKAALAYEGLKPAVVKRLGAAHDTLHEATGGALASLTHIDTLQTLSEDASEALLALAGAYLIHESPRAQGDPVARFHLDNGARLERINALANVSTKGLRQSAGLMVNYLYNLDRVEQSHEDFVNGTVSHARAVSSLI
jgi:malonyl-CoA decarboxylase